MRPRVPLPPNQMGAARTCRRIAVRFESRHALAQRLQHARRIRVALNSGRSGDVGDRHRFDSERQAVRQLVTQKRLQRRRIRDPHPWQRFAQMSHDVELVGDPDHGSMLDVGFTAPSGDDRGGVRPHACRRYANCGARLQRHRQHGQQRRRRLTELHRIGDELLAPRPSLPDGATAFCPYVARHDASAAALGHLAPKLSRRPSPGQHTRHRRRLRVEAGQQLLRFLMSPGFA